MRVPVPGLGAMDLVIFPIIHARLSHPSPVEEPFQSGIVAEPAVGARSDRHVADRCADAYMERRCLIVQVLDRFEL